MGAENDATGVSKRIDSPAPFLLLRQNFVIRLWGDLQQREITLRSIRFPKPTRREGNCKRVRKIRSFLILPIFLVARFFARLFDLWLEKERKRLLSRLKRNLNVKEKQSLTCMFPGKLSFSPVSHKLSQGTQVFVGS